MFVLPSLCINFGEIPAACCGGVPTTHQPTRIPTPHPRRVRGCGRWSVCTPLCSGLHRPWSGLLSIHDYSKTNEHVPLCDKALCHLPPIFLEGTQSSSSSALDKADASMIELTFHRVGLLAASKGSLELCIRRGSVRMVDHFLSLSLSLCLRSLPNEVFALST